MRKMYSAEDVESLINVVNNRLLNLRRRSMFLAAKNLKEQVKTTEITLDALKFYLDSLKVSDE